MKFKKAFLGLLFSSVLFAACSKDDDIDDVDEQLQNRWSVTNAILFEGPPTSDTLLNYTGTAADYFDFRSNGQVYTSLNGLTDTSTYRVIAGNKIVVDTDTADIRILTNSNLQLFTKTIDNGITQETTVNLRR